MLAEAPDGPLLHLRGRHQRGDLAAALSAAGIPCRDHIAYDQPALPLTDEAKGMLSGADRVYCPLFSPRTAGLFRKAVGSPPPPAVHVVAISASAASALHGWGAPLDIARNPDAASVTLALQAQIAAKNLP
ncbi:MAG: uroporphyrinogen-III synthase [Paracoccaceae bacterium]